MNKKLAWLYAVRPKTLPASISPVIAGSAVAAFDHSFRLIPALLCFMVALFAQIASNLANDYFDYKRGADGADRTGPKRAMASGWLTATEMKGGIALTLGVTVLCGLVLLLYGGIWLIWVGLFIVAGSMAYSAGPYPLAYKGFGDICVLIFYGIIPVMFTYYVQVGSFSLLAFLVSLSVGLMSVNILVVNNYRDYAQDKANNKRTTIVIFGKEFGRGLYLINGILAGITALPLLYDVPIVLIIIFFSFYILFVYTWRQLRNYEGEALNGTLAATARNTLIFTLILTALMLA